MAGIYCLNSYYYCKIDFFKKR